MLMFYTTLSVLLAEPSSPNVPSNSLSSPVQFPKEGTSFWFVLEPGPYSGVAGRLSILKVQDTSVCLRYDGGGQVISDFSVSGCIDCSNHSNTLKWTLSNPEDYDESVSRYLIERTCNGDVYTEYNAAVEYDAYGKKVETLCAYASLTMCGSIEPTTCTYFIKDRTLTKIEYKDQRGGNQIEDMVDCTWTPNKHSCVEKNGEVQTFPTEQTNQWCIKGNGCAFEVCPYISGFDLQP